MRSGIGWAMAVLVLAEGKRLMGEEKFQQARDYLTHAFEVEPNSAGGREALLMVADAYFMEDREDGYIRAEGKYRDFQTRFPTSQKAAYVQFQIADSNRSPRTDGKLREVWGQLNRLD